MTAVGLHARQLACLPGKLAVDPVDQQLGKAQNRIERRPELVAHIGEELGFVAAGCLQLTLFSSISRNSFAFWMASTDCAGEGLHQPHRGFREFAGGAALQNRRPEHAVGTDQRHDQHRAVPGRECLVAQRIGRPLA